MNRHTTALDIRSRCAVFTAFMAWTMGFSHPAAHMIILTAVCSCGLYAGLSIKKMLSGLLPLTPLFIMILALAGFMPASDFIHPENRIPLTLPGTSISMSRGGILLGATFVLRLANMVIATRIFLSVTPLEAFISLFAWLRLPASLSFMITTALRFVPALDHRRTLITAAQQARGADPDTGSWFSRFKVRTAVMIPLIVSAMSIADQLTMALMNRGFGYTARPTAMTRLKFTAKDVCIAALALAAAFVGIFIRFRTDYWQI